MRSLTTETPERRGLLDPDLGEPGEPIHATLELEDGTQLAYEIPQTKRDNCIALSARAGGERYVTRSMVDAHPYLTWRDFNYWIAELLESRLGENGTGTCLGSSRTSSSCPKRMSTGLAFVIWGKTRAGEA
jgi:hypothetical protein